MIYTAVLIQVVFVFADVPGKPRGPLEVSNVTDCSADLQWKAPDSDGGSPLTSYIIEMRPDSRSTWTKAGSVDGATTTFTVPDLKVDTEYHFRVIAVNAEGQSAPLEGKETAKPTKKISKLAIKLVFLLLFSLTKLISECCLAI